MREFVVFLLLCSIERWNVARSQPQRCPRVCLCSTSTVDSAESEDTGGPHGFSVSCDGIDLASLESNFISSIPRTATKLTLRRNGLTTLKAKIFKRFHMLNHLDLSGNELGFLEPEVFDGLTELRTLNLSSNKLQTIGPNVFSSLSAKLEFLDLSHNPIQFVPEKPMKQLKAIRFVDLAVKNLKCDCNLKWIVPWLSKWSVMITNESVCAEPKKLKGVRLDLLKKKQLVCKRSEEQFVAVIEQPSSVNQSQPREDVMVLEPQNPQVVFSGDRLALKCQLISESTDVSLEWLLNNVPAVHSPNLNITETRDQLSVTSHLVVTKLEQKHTGRWKCTKAFGSKTTFKEIEVMVMQQDTSALNTIINATQLITCAIETEERVDSTGFLKWPETRAGKTVSIPCFHKDSTQVEPRLSSTEIHLDVFSRNQIPRVYRECNSEGIWSVSNMSACDSLVNMWKSFVKVYSVRASPHIFEEVLVDLMDLVKKSIEADVFDVNSVQFVVGFLGNVCDHLSQVPSSSVYGVKVLVLRVLDSIVFSDRMLIEAGTKFNLTNSIMSGLAQVARTTSPTQVEFLGKNLHYTEISLDIDERWESVTVGFSQNTSTFLMAYTQTPRWKRSLAAIESVTQSSVVNVRIPKSSLRNVTLTRSPRLAFLWITRCSITPGFSDDGKVENHFFPFDGILGVLPCWEDERGQVDQIMRHSQIEFGISVPTQTMYPAVWMRSSNDGDTFGGWDVSRCSLLNQTDKTVFSCHQAGFMTILQKLTEVQTAGLPGGLNLFPWMLGATGFLEICLIVCIWTYTSCASSIHVFDGLRHSLVNSWICLAVLLPIFSVGINLVYWEYVCLGIGVAIHYFLICSLFWTLLIIKAVHFKLWTSVSPPVPSGSEEDLPSSSQKAATNLAGTYLVGYGVGLTVCCFSVALSMSEYTETKFYCFLSPGATFLGAVVVPCGILLIIAIFLLLHGICLSSALASSSRNSIENTVNRGESTFQQQDQLDESTHTAYRPNDSDCVGETKDGQPVELITLFPTGSRRGSISSDNKRSTNGGQNRRPANMNTKRSSMAESNHEKISVRMVYLTVDEELGAGRQLCLAGVFLLFYISLLASAVFYISRPGFLTGLIPHYLLVVSGVFCGCAVVLALFLLFAHAVCRPSVRHKWAQCAVGCCQCGRGWRRTSDTPQVLTSQDELAIAETVRMRTTSAYEQAAAEFDGRLSSNHSKRDFYAATSGYGATGPLKKNIGVIRRTPTKTKTQLGGEMILRSPTFENYPAMDSASSWAPPTSVTGPPEEIDEMLLQQPKLQKLAARKYYEKQRLWRESQRENSRNSYNGSHFSQPGDMILEAVVDTEVEEEELMRLREEDDEIEQAELSTAYLLQRRKLTQDSYEMDEVFVQQQGRKPQKKGRSEPKYLRGDTSDDQRLSDSSSRTSSQARRNRLQKEAKEPQIRLHSTNDLDAAKGPRVRLYRNTSDSAVPSAALLSGATISDQNHHHSSDITEETPLGSAESKNGKVRRDLMTNGDFNGNEKQTDREEVLNGGNGDVDSHSSASSQHGSMQELNSREEPISPVDSQTSRGPKSETCV